MAPPSLGCFLLRMSWSVSPSEFELDDESSDEDDSDSWNFCFLSLLDALHFLQCEVAHSSKAEINSSLSMIFSSLAYCSAFVQATFILPIISFADKLTLSGLLLFFDLTKLFKISPSSSF